MRSIRLVLVLLVGGVGAMLASLPAFAETVLFSDNFESQPGVQTSAVNYPDYGTEAGDCYPRYASPGSWSVVNEWPGDVQVTTYSSPGPGAAGGAKYLRLNGDGFLSSATANFTEQATAGDKIRLAADVYAPASGNRLLAPNFVGWDASGHRELAMGSNGSGGWMRYDSVVDDNLPISGLTLPTGAWTHLQMDWTLGASTMNVTFGATSATVPVDGANNGKLASWQLKGSYYDGVVTMFDNVKVTLNPSSVPEPTSIALLVSALFGLLAYAWRKRR